MVRVELAGQGGQATDVPLRRDSTILAPARALNGSDDSCSPVLAAMSGMEREYIRDRTLEGHESARKRGKTIGGAGVTDNDMLSMALHLRDQEMSLRDLAKRLVITTGAKKGQHPSPATIMRMLREHDEQTAGRRIRDHPPRSGCRRGRRSGRHG